MQNNVSSPPYEGVVEPFLRWTGSKRWLVKDNIQDFLPSSFNSYHEPFVGGGAVFFYLKSNKIALNNKYYLSDSNKELINCYVQIRDNLTGVLKYLKTFRNSEDDYYSIRAQNTRSDIKRAAIFIYLNRTSFNGIYRVNSMGEYNVPYGRRENVDIITSTLLREVKSILSSVNIQNQSFEKSLRNIQSGDLVFLDPPYTVAHENNGFIEYNQKLFSWKDQLRLKDFVEKIIDKKAYFILTNASHYSIVDLYKGIAKISKTSRYSKVGGRNKTRGLYNELIIHNTK